MANAPFDYAQGDVVCGVMQSGVEAGCEVEG